MAVVDIVTVFEALFVLYMAVPPLVAVIALVRHQFWSHDEKSKRYLGDKRFFWFYVFFFVLMIAATAFLVAARAMAFLIAISDNVTFPAENDKIIFAVHASVGLVASILFAIAARYVHIGPSKDGSVMNVFSNWQLAVYGFAWLAFVCELICIGLLCYGIHATYGNPIPFWFTLPFPVAFTGFLVLCIWNRGQVAAASANV
jgi:hypothetical protein